MEENKVKKCNTCESCLMPFSKDPTGDKRENEKYCSYCFNNGKFAYEGNDMKEFQKVCYQAMRSHNMGYIESKFYTWMIRFAPRWKK